MTPNQTSPILTTGGLNIDQMLQNLSTQPSLESAVPLVGGPLPIDSNPVLGNTFSIDTLSKPSSPEISSGLKIEKQNSLRFPNWARTTASIISTLLLLVVGGFVFRTTYPVETKDFTDKLFGAVDTVITTTENNINPNEILVTNTTDTSGSIEGVHSVAPDNYITNTPLADAIDQSQTSLENTITSTEQVLDTVVGVTDTISSISGGGTPIDIQMPSVENTIDAKKIQENLLTLSQSAQEATTNLIGNDGSKLSIMRVIYRKSQALITQLSDTSFVLNTDFVEQVQQLQALYDKTMNQ